MGFVRDEQSPGHVPVNLCINKELLIAIEEFKVEANYEKELASDSIMVGHMIDFAMHRTLMLILDGRETSEIVLYLNRAKQSFVTNRRKKHPESNPIRAFKREH